RCMQRHRHIEFIRFLNAVEREVAADKSIHVVLDNYATHKHPKVLAWLARHPRWTFHFTPTSASWLNAVENFFSKMTRQRIRRGVFGSVVDLQAAINAYLAEHNDNPTPFVWTKSAEAILASLVANWMMEAAKFTPNLRLVVWHGLDRHERREEVGGADLVV